MTVKNGLYWYWYRKNVPTCIGIGMNPRGVSVSAEKRRFNTTDHGVLGEMLNGNHEHLRLCLLPASQQ